MDLKAKNRDIFLAYVGKGSIKSERLRIQQRFQTREEAENWRKRKSDELGLTKNQLRFLDEKTVEMKLTQGKTVTFDRDDLCLVETYTWSYHHKGYAHAYIKDKDSRIVTMHRLLFPELREIDHIDGKNHRNRSLHSQRRQTK